MFAARIPSLTITHCALTLYAILVATSFPVGRQVAGTIEPAVLTFYRFLLAATFFGLICLLRRQFAATTVSMLLRTSVLAGIMAVFFIGMFKALETASALNAGAIFTLAPLAALGFGYALNGEGATRVQVILLVIAGLSAVWVVFDGSFTMLISFNLGKGEVLFGLVTLVFALNAPVTRMLYRGEPSILFAFWILAGASVFSGSVSLSHYQTLAPFEISAENWMWIGYLAILPTAVTFFIVVIASGVLPPHKITAYTYFVPAFIAIIEWFLFGYSVENSVLIGILLIFSTTIALQAISAKPANDRMSCRA